MRDCQACAYGHELQVNTTNVPLGPLASAIEMLLPSTLVILMSALGALLPIARAVIVSSATAADADASASAASAIQRMLRPFMSPPRSRCPGRGGRQHGLDPGLQGVVGRLAFVEPLLVPRPVVEQGRGQCPTPQRIEA